MTRYSRRTLLKAGAAFAGASAIGSPAIVSAQAARIKIGHLVPLTGFLGAIGSYAQLGVKMAAEEINASGGIMGKQIDLMSEDSVNPATAVDQGAAHDRAGRRGAAVRRNLFGLVADHHAGRRAQQEGVLLDRRPLRRAARQGLQPLLLPLRHPQHRDGQRRRHRAQPEGHGEGQEVRHADRGLHFRPRPAEGRQRPSSAPTTPP